MKQFTYYLLYGLVYALSLLPFRLLYLISDGLFPIVYYIVRYRRKIVRKNLTASFPEKSLTEIKEIERRFYHWFCDYIFETFKLLSMSDEKLLRHLEYRGGEQIEKVFAEGRNCAAVMGHYCNWEWFSSVGLAFPHYPEAVKGLIYHPLRNDQMDWLFLAIRSAHGGICVNKRHVLRHLIDIKQAGHNYLFGYISDQTPKMENIHLWLDFLHQDTPVFTGGERIMKKMNEAVFYLDVERPKRGKSVCTFRELSTNAALEEENAITRRFFQMLEENIHRQPAYYLWTHNRWKRTREEFNERFIFVNGHNILHEDIKNNTKLSEE